MAKITVLCGPPGCGKVQRLLQRFGEVVRATTNGTALWLAPNYRSIVEIRTRLSEEGSDPAAAQFLTFQDFADEIVRNNDAKAKPISHVQRCLLTGEVIAQLHERGQLSHFQRVLDTHGFAETVFQFLEELKQNEIRPRDLEDKLQHWFPSSSLGTSGKFSETSELFPQPFLSKDQQCALIYKEYEALLNRHHLYDSEGRLSYARDLLHQQKRRPFDQVRAVFVHGFTSFTRTQHDILENLCEWIEELWLDQIAIECSSELKPEAQTKVAENVPSLALQASMHRHTRPQNALTLPDEGDEERAELFSPVKRTWDSLMALSPTVDHVEKESARPAGLRHLQKELFRPLKKVQRSDNADGLFLIEAPGMIGEARLVARRIKTLLDDGTAPDDILVVLRDMRLYADLIHEVFDEYGIPVDIEGTELLLRNAAVSTLLRTWRIPDEGYTFPQVTALLRSTYFQPQWPEVQAVPEVAQQSEVLLRLLEEPRGREEYLKAVERWAENPPPGLEDEQAEESRRRRIHELAKNCRPFLERFLHSWDTAPARATLEQHITWLHRLADDLGISNAAQENPRDQAALMRLWNELDYWLQLVQQFHGQEHVIDRKQFDHLLHTVAVQTGMARTRRGPGRVRVLSAPLARSLPADHVFLMGLAERSFPQLVPPESLFDEQQRQALKQAGLDMPGVNDLLPEEMLLFYQIITSARQHLTLSYPAVDEKGQELLPSSFLAMVLDTFQPDTIPTEQRSMLIEKYDQQEPLSLAEYRVQAACAFADNAALWPMPTELADHLMAARQVAEARFHAHDHGTYDGLFSDPQIIAEVEGLFGSERVFSPTTLESYIACPFKFFLQHVLKLETLDDPSEEIESTERGLTVHRAMARLHRRRRSAGAHGPTADVDEQLLQELETAVAESSTQSSPAAVRLWHLEGERLKRFALRYREHWQKFVAPWLKDKLHLQPEFFEIGFGLPPAEGEIMAEPLVIEMEGLQVRISGRIDRVDTVELPDGGTGFWIVDYKTGRGSYYTGKDLKEFRKLQLTLYALAVEKVLLADRNARPLGLAYWLVTDTGPKIAMPDSRKALSWIEETNAWREISTQLQRWVVEIVSRIRHGEFALKPKLDDCTSTCDFSQICRISQSRATVNGKSWSLPLPMISGEE